MDKIKYLKRKSEESATSGCFSFGLNFAQKKEAMARRADQIKSDFLIKASMEAML